MYEARIVLHKTRRDAFGIPMLSSQGGKHPLTAVQAKIMTDAAESVLREADLIRNRREGKFIYYELNTSVLEEIMLWLRELKGDKKDV